MGGGGGNAGAIKLPDDVEKFYQDMLYARTGITEQTIYVRNPLGGTIPVTITADGNEMIQIYKTFPEVMNEGLANNPWTDTVSYDPAARVVDLLTAADSITTFNTELGSISDLFNSAQVDADIVSYAAFVDADLDTNVYPRFEAGMRDVNAVMSSAFTAGRAAIEASRNREVAKYTSALRYKAFGDDALQKLRLSMEAKQILGQMTLEMNRLSIIAEKEEVDKQLELDSLEQEWNFTVFQHGANLMAGAQGGVIQPMNKPSPGQSAMGGAAAGATVGAQASGGYGAVIGGIIGAAAGYASAQ